MSEHECQAGIITPDMLLRCTEPPGHPPPHMLHLDDADTIITVSWTGPSEMIDLREDEKPPGFSLGPLHPYM